LHARTHSATTLPGVLRADSSHSNDRDEDDHDESVLALWSNHLDGPGKERMSNIAMTRIVYVVLIFVFAFFIARRKSKRERPKSTTSSPSDQ
jgi:hypothetical protein